MKQGIYSNLKGNIPDYVFDYKRKSDILPEKGFFLILTHIQQPAMVG